VVADHHALLEEGRVGTSVCEPATLQVTHVVQLATVQSDNISVTVDWRTTPCTFRWDLAFPSSWNGDYLEDTLITLGFF
jgi:hypothetical protein